MIEAGPTAALVQRLLPASPDAVFDQWLDPDALAEWMCPRPARATKIDIDPSVGGRLRIDIDEEGLVLSVTGHYLDLDRPRRLSFTWSCSTWADPTLESLVTVTLEPRGDQTLMTIRHALLPPELVARHHDGWVRIAEQLDEELTGRS